MLAELKEEDLARSKSINQGSVQDLLGHLAAWDEEILRVIQAFAMQDNPKFLYEISGKDDYAAWNAEQRTRRAGQTLEQVRHELELARKDLIQVVDGLTDPVLRRERTTPWKTTASGYTLLIEQMDHDKEHTEQVAAWLKKMARWKRARAKLSEKRKTKA